MSRNLIGSQPVGEMRPSRAGCSHHVATTTSANSPINTTQCGNNSRSIPTHAIALPNSAAP